MNSDATNLDRLHDIIVAAPAPWWPPAPGWYWLLGSVLVLLLLLVLRSIIRFQQNRYRREALEELDKHETALENPDQRAKSLLALSELLKRTALTAFPRGQVATLAGPDWFRFLDRTATGAHFSEGLGSKWQTAIYDPRTALGLDESMLRDLTASIRHWIKKHRRDDSSSSNPSPPRPSFSSSSSNPSPPRPSVSSSSSNPSPPRPSFSSSSSNPSPPRPSFSSSSSNPSPPRPCFSSSSSNSALHDRGRGTRTRDEDDKGRGIDHREATC